MGRGRGRGRVVAGRNGRASRGGRKTRDQIDTSTRGNLQPVVLNGDTAPPGVVGGAVGKGGRKKTDDQGDHWSPWYSSTYRLSYREMDGGRRSRTPRNSIVKDPFLVLPDLVIRTRPIPWESIAGRFVVMDSHGMLRSRWSLGPAVDSADEEKMEGDEAMGGEGDVALSEGNDVVSMKGEEDGEGEGEGIDKDVLGLDTSNETAASVFSLDDIGVGGVDQPVEEADTARSSGLGLGLEREGEHRGSTSRPSLLPPLLTGEGRQGGYRGGATMQILAPSFRAVGPLADRLEAGTVRMSGWGSGRWSVSRSHSPSVPVPARTGFVEEPEGQEEMEVDGGVEEDTHQDQPTERVAVVGTNHVEEGTAVEEERVDHPGVAVIAAEEEGARAGLEGGNVEVETPGGISEDGDGVRLEEDGRGSEPLLQLEEEDDVEDISDATMGKRHETVLARMRERLAAYQATVVKKKPPPVPRGGRGRRGGRFGSVRSGRGRIGRGRVGGAAVASLGVSAPDEMSEDSGVCGVVSGVENAGPTTSDTSVCDINKCAVLPSAGRGTTVLGEVHDLKRKRDVVGGPEDAVAVVEGDVDEVEVGAGGTSAYSTREGGRKRGRPRKGSGREMGHRRAHSSGETQNVWVGEAQISLPSGLEQSDCVPRPATAVASVKEGGGSGIETCSQPLARVNGDVNTFFHPPCDRPVATLVISEDGHHVMSSTEDGGDDNSATPT